jgi:hypothetical protein
LPQAELRNASGQYKTHKNNPNAFHSFLQNLVSTAESQPSMKICEDALRISHRYKAGSDSRLFYCNSQATACFVGAPPEVINLVTQLSTNCHSEYAVL